MSKNERGLLGYIGVPSHLGRYREMLFKDLGIRSSSQHGVLRARQSKAPAKRRATLWQEVDLVGRPAFMPCGNPQLCAKYFWERAEGDYGMTRNRTEWKEGKKYLWGIGRTTENSSKQQSWEGVSLHLDHVPALQSRCISLCSQAVGRPSSGLSLWPPVPRASFWWFHFPRSWSTGRERVGQDEANIWSAWHLYYSL